MIRLGVTFLLGFTLLGMPAFGKAPEGWLTDIEEAVTVAKEKDKLIMVEFTGSDWCPPCIIMKKEVFSKDEFVKKASEDFILVLFRFS